MAAVGVAVYIGSQLWAQQPGQPGAGAAPASTKVGLVNLSQVIQGYKKFKTYQDELKKLVEPFQKKDEEIVEGLKKAQKALEDPKTAGKDREDWDGYKTQLLRAREDLTNKVKKELAKKSDEQIVQLYKEVEEAVKGYAAPNGYHVVLQYNDAPSPNEKLNPGYIQRKLERAGGACMPMYIAGGLDISNDIINNLNQRYDAQGGATPVSAAPAANPTGPAANTKPGG